MFKFKIISGKELRQNAHERETNTSDFLQESRTVFKNDEISTLLVTDLAEQNTIGSLSLTQRGLTYLQEEVSSLVPTDTGDRGYLWECSDLRLPCFQKFSDRFSSSSHFFHHFFDTLYQGIVAFGLQNDVGFVGVKLTPDDYLSTKEFGFWPYVVELLPETDSEQFFYGILPLRGCLYEEYKKKWEEWAAEGD
jgi:hypothetical protein